jgi:hypothetical protein
MASKRRPPDKAVPYDAEWLKEENDRRRAKGRPPLRQRKRSAVERERLRSLRQIVSPMAAADINPDYQLVEVEDRPETRQPDRERARRVLAALFPDDIPDAAALPNKHLAKKVNDWLAVKGQPPVKQRTIQRAAGRK